ncbi:hypothetical protein LOC67_02545 [Stieleria sp. JC731]|uniref:hypothetical protein n=1 Tax=Pirellulaceae TaxID=2691357 RepID=UPI001E3BA4AB|nr:hypothetical protein [Stieleria sp. JC731]MCC9599424.1 hypothetical protein [Stieleria sp. JC731]
MPVAFLGSLLVITAVEFAVSKVSSAVVSSSSFVPPDRVPTLVETIVEHKLQVANSSSAPADILVIGDSSGLMGVKTEQLEDVTGLTAYNLCTISLTGIEGHQKLFERYVKKHGHPRLVVVHLAYYDLRYSEQDIAGMGFLSHLNECLGLNAETQIDQDSSITAAGQSLIPSQRLRLTARNYLTLEDSADQFYRRPRQQWGSHLEVIASLNRQKGYLEEISETRWDQPQELKLVISEFQLQGLASLLDRCSELSIDTAVVLNPLPENAKTEVTRSHLQVVDQQILQCVDTFPSSEVLFGQPRFYSDRQFATLNHLSPQASEQNTKQIAAKISELLSVK